MSMHGGKIITIIDGRPVPGYIEPFSKESAAQMAGSALAKPYKPKDSADAAENTGKSNLQVANELLAQEAASGSLHAYNALLDRWVGKPLQATQNTNVNITLQDFLSSCPKPPKRDDAGTIDITARILADEDEELLRGV